MKDYYKILGIRATASPEDIHARWIELMRKFHPDRRKKGGAQDERIKEINEAYEVLKHSSARGHYDLQRTYYQKKRTLHLQRFILPPTILLLLLFLGLIYSQRSDVTPSPESTLASVRRLISIKASAPNEINQTNEINESNQTNPTSVPKDRKTSPLFAKAQDPLVVQKPPPSPNQFNEINQINQIDQTNESNQTNPTSRGPKVKTSAKVYKPVPSRSRSKSRGLTTKINETNQTNEIDEINESNQINQINEPKFVTALDVPNEPNDPNPLNDLNQTDQIDQINQTNGTTESTEQPNQRNNRTSGTNQINQLSQLTPPPLLAREEEVKHFLALYRGRYNRKDIDALFSLFSPRAVQNQRDGFDEIKKIYSDFFDQSKELRYHMEDTSIEIFQNAVEVRARYEIDQIRKHGRGKKVWRGEIRWILVKENGALKIRFLDYRPQESR